MGFSFFFFSGGGGGGEATSLGSSSITGVAARSSLRGVDPPSSSGKGISASVNVLLAEGLREELELLESG